MTPSLRHGTQNDSELVSLSTVAPSQDCCA
jgi:hypothetical protein